MTKRLTTLDIRNRKHGKPLVCLTAYTEPLTRLLDPACDILLVGDTVGMVLYGLDSTLPVTLEMMLNHGRAVVKASKHACIVIDMPFGTYQAAPGEAFTNAARLLSQTGAHAVKLEGGIEMAETIEFLVARGIPVMAHVGLKPQSVHIYGNYRPRGTEPEEADYILEDAKAVEKAGAFSVVIENIPGMLARTITQELSIPTIGIGTEGEGDGQILVTEDMLGLSAKTPKFVKPYASLATSITDAVNRYAADVTAKRFSPEKES